MSGFVQLFVDTAAQLSVKWLLLTMWLALTLLLIALKIIYDLGHEKHPAPPYEVPIKYLAEKQIFLIRRNDNFLNNIIVGCYLQRDEVDTLACVGVVHIVQEKFIQIKLIGQPSGDIAPSMTPEALARFVVRPVVPFDALNQFTSIEAADE